MHDALLCVFLCAGTDCQRNYRGRSCTQPRQMGVWGKGSRRGRFRRPCVDIWRRRGMPFSFAVSVINCRNALNYSYYSLQCSTAALRKITNQSRTGDMRNRKKTCRIDLDMDGWLAGLLRLFFFQSFILNLYFKTASTWLNHRHRAANHQDSPVHPVLFCLRVSPRVWGRANLSAVCCGNWRVGRSSLWAPWADDNGGSSIKWSEGKLKGVFCLEFIYKRPPVNFDKKRNRAFVSLLNAAEIPLRYI